MENTEADEPTVRNHPKSVGKMCKSQRFTQREIIFNILILRETEKRYRNYELDFESFRIRFMVPTLNKYRSQSPEILKPEK